MITELTILKTEKPENIMEQIVCVEISGLEKEQLTTQLIEELYIRGLERAENLYQMVINFVDLFFEIL